jgi:hypothetical protein
VTSDFVFTGECVEMSSLRRWIEAILNANYCKTFHMEVYGL